jgi:uridine kinase
VTARRIHILGGSGSGTSTLGAALAGSLGYSWLDADDFFWLPTDPPYTTQRDKPERLRLLRDALTGDGYVLSGSVARWDDEIENSFDAIIFLFVPPEARMQRLRDREMERFGFLHEDFLDWAAKYDTAGMEMRSLAVHNAWLAERTSPVVRIEGIPTTAVSLAQARQFVGTVDGKST